MKSLIEYLDCGVYYTASARRLGGGNLVVQRFSDII